MKKVFCTLLLMLILVITVASCQEASESTAPFSTNPPAATSTVSQTAVTTSTADTDETGNGTTDTTTEKNEITLPNPVVTDDPDEGWGPLITMVPSNG